MIRPVILLLFAASVGFTQSPKSVSDLFQVDEFTYTGLETLAQETPAGVETAEPSSSKSRGKAFLMSLILPGLGERYAGATTKSQIFMGTELGLWLTYAGLVTFRDWRKDDYRNYAAEHAGVDLDGKSDTYFIDVGNYNSIDEYNQAKLRQRNLNAYYRDVDTYHWDWESEAHRDRFDQLRISSDTADNRSTFVIGLILANHVISAIDAVWTVHQRETNTLSNVDWDLRLGDGLHQPRVAMSLSAHF